MNTSLNRRDQLWLKYFTKISIRRRLFYYFVSLVIFPLVLLGMISYFMAADTLEKNITQSSRQVVDQVLAHLELYFRQYQQDSLSALGNKFAQDFLAAPRGSAALKTNAAYVKEYLFNPILTGRYEIEGIYLAGLDGRITGSEKNNESILTWKPGLETELAWLKRVPRDGSLLITGVHTQPYHTANPVITLARRISAPDDPGAISGVFWVDINLLRIQEICEQVQLGKSGFISIIDSLGKIIYHPQTELIGKEFSIPFYKKIRTDPSGHFLDELDGVQSLIIYNTPFDTKWTMVAVVPYQEITGGIRRLKNITLIVIGICLAASVLLSITFAATITRPIERLEQTMAEASRGYLEGSVPVERSDEIGRLSQNFNKMLQKIQTLINENYAARIREMEALSKQQQAELRALQAQINPHFLYNTLGTISSLAFIEGVESISRMASALSDFFRYSIHNEEMMVTLGDELAQVERYFTIQKIRFGDRIGMEVDVPGDLLNQPFVKLTLQPLVENACVHGLEQSSAGRIKIKARVTEDNLLITVSDNGSGIPAATLKALQDYFAAPKTSGESTLAKTAIGVRNVHSRIRLCFGPDYGLSISSEPGKGTVVTIKMPYGRF